MTNYTMSISKLLDYPVYESMEQRLRGQVYEYAQRAQVYITQNKLDHAIGCLNKAVRKIRRADALKLKLTPLDEAVFGPLLVELADIVARKVIEDQ